MKKNRVELSLIVGVLACLLVTTAPSCFGQGMDYPLAVVAGPDNSLYVADRNLPGIWKIQGGKAAIYYQGSKKFRTPLNAVVGMTNLLIDKNPREEQMRYLSAMRKASYNLLNDMSSIIIL